MNMKRINRIALAGVGALALSACSENAWNNELDGYKDAIAEADGTEFVERLDYTLTSDDYALLAKNSTNKTLAGSENSAALAAVGSQGYFAGAITPEAYIPALLSDVAFPYFTLDNGSAVNVTYRYAEALPAELTAMAAASKLTISDEDYQQVWGSDNDYTASFAPSHTAAKELPKLLKNALPAAEAGQYVIVNYNTSDVDPVFTAPSTPDTPDFALSSVLGSLAVDQAVDINGLVMATSTQGPIVTDATGSVFVYAPANNSDLKVGDQVVISSTVSSYNYGFQIAKGADADVKGNQAVTYPEAAAWTATDVDAFVATGMAEGASPVSPVYVKLSGKAIVTNYINISIDGTTVQLSPYGASDEVKALFTDGADVTVEGYAMAIASKGKYVNMIVTKVDGKTAKAAAKAPQSRVVELASTNENAIYCFDGSAWAPAASTLILSHADYQAMGQRYDNLSGEGPELYLPTFMRNALPYAQAGDIEYLVYYYYTGSATVTRAEQYVFDGTAWTAGVDVKTATLQFVKSKGVWNYDPSVTVTLPAGRGIAISTLYFQTCVDWVKNNVPDGAAYVTSYGNNEYYCGTSAYQGNVDLRPSAAKTQYAGYDSMTDAEVVALEKKRFDEEVMPAALGILHPDMAPVEGIDVTLTLNFVYYDGTSHDATAVFKCVGKGKFEFVSDTWNDAE